MAVAERFDALNAQNVALVHNCDFNPVVTGAQFKTRCEVCWDIHVHFRACPRRFLITSSLIAMGAATKPRRRGKPRSPAWEKSEERTGVKRRGDNLGEKKRKSEKHF